MQRCAAFHLGRHCLPKHLFRGFQFTNGKINTIIVKPRSVLSTRVSERHAIFANHAVFEILEQFGKKMTMRYIS